jgi:UV DNA damage endonuclease
MGVGLIEWNERFGIRFMRISSEMFPFASHGELGYRVEYARPELSSAGKLAMQYGHRLTMHPVCPQIA